MKRKLIALLLVAVLLLVYGDRLGLDVGSYTTAYEGAKARFAGAVWSETGESLRIWDHTYEPTGISKPSLASFDAGLALDVDEPYTGKPNIIGEMTSVMVPHVSFNRPDKVPAEWWSDWINWVEPAAAYEWTIQNDDGTESVYRMEEWKTKWFISLTAEWDRADWLTEDDETEAIKNLQIWFELDVQPVWYFEGQAQAYFAIAKIELTHFRDYAVDAEKRVVESRPELSVQPMSPGSILPLYTELFGDEETGGVDAFYTFRGRRLNPQYFRDKVYTYISLLDFGVEDWLYAIGYGVKGDVVTMGFTVTQFVVGEWRVKDIGDIPDDYGRRSKLRNYGADIVEWMSQPGNMLLMMAFLMIAAIIVVSWFNPGVWIGLLSLFRGRKR